MKALTILGTASNVGKSWVVTALGAWLQRQGVKVAPFKAQNMSNNAYVTLEGREIGRAQAVQASACGQRAIAQHNPILLKPAGNSTSQLVVLGEPRQHIKAADYYRHIDSLWSVIQDTLDGWKHCCDVLLLEGAGSPVELNLMHRDIVNLRPLEYLDGRWLLVADIEKGGVFAQAVGTHALLPSQAQTRGLGLIVNKFRGDLGLFATAADYFHQCLPQLPYLGVLPYWTDLQPESEDSLCEAAEAKGTGAILAWIRLPYLSNSQDSQPWQLDTGIQIRWVRSPSDLTGAEIIVIPGSKNTLHDLRWLYTTGLAQAIQGAAAQGIPVVGICGGYQMLCQGLVDPKGFAGDAGAISGLGLLPAITHFAPQKQVRQVEAIWANQTWQTYEIHMGHTQAIAPCQPLLQIQTQQGPQPEGMRQGKVWGTYLHGLFELGQVRRDLTQLAGIEHYQPASVSWQAHQQQLYQGMADGLEAHLNLEPVRHYLGL